MHPDAATFESMNDMGRKNCTLIAIESDHIHLLECFHARRPGNECFSVYIVEKACRDGKLHLLRFCVEVAKAPVCQSAWNAAAQEGHLEILQYLHDFDEALPEADRTGSHAWTTAVMDIAASRGWLDMVQWLTDNRSEDCSERGFDYAVQGGHTEVVKHLIASGLAPEITPRVMDMAASSGRLELVKYLHENRSEGCTTDAMDGAAIGGHLEVVKFLHENRAQGCTVKTMDGAVIHDHLAVVEFLHEHRTEGCSDSALEDAADNCAVDTVAFMCYHRSEGCLRRAYRCIPDDDEWCFRDVLGGVQFLAEELKELLSSQPCRSTCTHCFPQRARPQMDA